MNNRRRKWCPIIAKAAGGECGKVFTIDASLITNAEAQRDGNCLCELSFPGLCSSSPWTGNPGVFSSSSAPAFSPGRAPTPSMTNNFAVLLPMWRDSFVTDARCIIVSSGAVAAGMRVVGLKVRPLDLTTGQACAAVGQSKLMHLYASMFAKHQLNVAQLLLTHSDLDSRTRHQNAKNTLRRLLDCKNVVPVVNENDSVAVEELRFGTTTVSLPRSRCWQKPNCSSCLQALTA